MPLLPPHWPLSDTAVWAPAGARDSLRAGASSEPGGGGWDTGLRWKVEVQAWKRPSLEDRGGPHETGTGCCKRMLHPSGREEEEQQQGVKTKLTGCLTQSRGGECEQSDRRGEVIKTLLVWLWEKNRPKSGFINYQNLSKISHWNYI